MTGGDVDVLPARRRIVRAQLRALAKFPAALSDEPSPRPDVERKQCPSWFANVGWYVVVLYVALTVTYCSLFLMTRADQVKRLYVEKNETLTNAELSRATNAIIFVWLQSALLGLLVGFVVVEPLILFLKFTLFPACVRRFGTPTEVVRAERRVERARRAYGLYDPSTTAAVAGVGATVAAYTQVQAAESAFAGAVATAEPWIEAGFEALAEVVRSLGWRRDASRLVSGYIVCCCWHLPRDVVVGFHGVSPARREGERLGSRRFIIGIAPLLWLLLLLLLRAAAAALLLLLLLEAGSRWSGVSDCSAAAQTQQCAKGRRGVQALPRRCQHRAHRGW